MSYSKRAWKNPLLCNPVSYGKISDWPKFKVFAEDKINVAELMISLSDRVGNIVGKEENAGYHHFSFSHNVYKSPFLQGR